jgi:hypothetical protein
MTQILCGICGKKDCEHVRGLQTQLVRSKVGAMKLLVNTLNKQAEEMAIGASVLNPPKKSSAKGWFWPLFLIAFILIGIVAGLLVDDLKIQAAIFGVTALVIIVAVILLLRKKEDD